jgi:integrase
LRWTDVDLDADVIRVEHSWDAVEGPVEPKTRTGRRTVPVASVLREHLVARRLRSGGRGLVFGRDGVHAFRPDKAQKRADAAWEAAGLARITLHEARHTFASLMIAAGCNAKALSTYMGHANIAITYDRYGHLMPGNEAEAAGLLDACLKRATGG